MRAASAAPDPEAAIRAAHAEGDGAAIAAAWLSAADAAEAGGLTDAACFFLTQAWVFALEAGSPLAAECRARLAERGRV